MPAEMKHADLILKHLIHLSEGKCTITEDEIENENDEHMQQILGGILHLHEEIHFKENLLIEKEKLEYSQQWISQLRHEINNPLTISIMLIRHEENLKDKDKILHSLERIAFILKKMDQALDSKDSKNAIEGFVQLKKIDSK